MKKQNKICLIAGLVIVACIAVLGVVWIMVRNAGMPALSEEKTASQTGVSILSASEMSAAASEILAEVSFDPTFSYTENDPVYFGFELKYPCWSQEEGMALSIEQLDENIADLQAQYLEYLKTCKAEKFRADAQQAYDDTVRMIETIKSIKTRTPDQLKESKEIAFYETYNTRVSECENPEKFGWSSEYAAQMLDIAERAKRYYEDGTITIDQACQALGIGGGTLSYDPTFSLPE
jgi:hypothetical protein